MESVANTKESQTIPWMKLDAKVSIKVSNSRVNEMLIWLLRSPLSGSSNVCKSHNWITVVETKMTDEENASMDIDNRSRAIIEPVPDNPRVRISKNGNE